MVRKNDASAVQSQTSAAFEKLAELSSPSRPPSTPTVTAALDLSCKLSGIGPATGTLILNIYDPVHIPFFQDEMYMWFFPNSKGDKLKYSQKEYLQLFEAVKPVLQRLDVKAADLEKVSYVLVHLDLLEEAERATLENSFKETNDVPVDQEETKPATIGENKGVKNVRAEKPAKPSTTKKGTKRSSTVAIDEHKQQPPKRQSQRTKR